MIYGNLAYKYDYPEVEAEKADRLKKAVAKRSKKKHKEKRTDISYGGKIAMVFTVAVAAVFMIIQYVTVNETSSDLATAVTEYRFQESVTAQKSFELEQSVDLSKIEAEATSRLGMQRPEAHQIVYLDVKKSDVTIKTAGEVEGFSNRFANLMNSIKSNIVGFFSI